MATPTLTYYSPKPFSLLRPARALFCCRSFSPPSTSSEIATFETQNPKPLIWDALGRKKITESVLAVGIALTFVDSASAAELQQLGSSGISAEPPNALSLPTWAIHISSVVEWVTAMVLVWQYGEKSGFESWKGLSWGMVPLLGGALCACTWHFFYNSESLEALVALQAALTAIGNATMCLAAFRIYKSVGSQSKSL